MNNTRRSRFSVVAFLFVFRFGGDSTGRALHPGSNTERLNFEVRTEPEHEPRSENREA
jgi:hypothetical protein